jgi:hypothetical protein
MAVAEGGAVGVVECEVVAAAACVAGPVAVGAALREGAEILERALAVQVVISVVAEVPVAASMVEAVPAMPGGSTALLGGASTVWAEVDSTAEASMARGVGSTGVPALAGMGQVDSMALLAVAWTVPGILPVPAIFRGPTFSGSPTEGCLGLEPVETP